jgi:arylsulfatase A-like enzyme
MKSGKYLVLGLALGLCSALPAASKPNIIFIMADDLGVGDVACYGFQDTIRMPNVSRMADEGMRFTHCHTGSPVCGPSRCVLMTGLHSGHARRRDNTTKDGKQKPESLIPLAPEDITVAEMLKTAGYKTAGWGKWGLGNHGTTGSPDKQGFDYFFGYLDQVKAHSYYVDTLWRNGEFVPVERIDGKPRYSHDVMAEDVLRYIRENKDDPMFLYLAYTIPHGRYEVPEVYEFYQDEPWSPTEKIFASMITRMDEDIGEMLALLKELGLDENTIVFFTSDNGPAKIWGGDKFVSSGAQRGKKRDVYQGGVNEPMVVRWPGKVPAGTVSGFQWVFYDFMATSAELAGCRAPHNDGISVLPALLGKKQKPHDYIYWEFYSNFQQAVLMGDMKAVRHGTKEPVELYNISNDRKEANDVAARHPELVERMKAIMEKEHVEDPRWPALEYRKKRKGKKRG